MRSGMETGSASRTFKRSLSLSSSMSLGCTPKESLTASPSICTPLREVHNRECRGHSGADITPGRQAGPDSACLVSATSSSPASLLVAATMPMSTSSSVALSSTSGGGKKELHRLQFRMASPTSPLMPYDPASPLSSAASPLTSLSQELESADEASSDAVLLSAPGEAAAGSLKHLLLLRVSGTGNQGLASASPNSGYTTAALAPSYGSKSSQAGNGESPVSSVTLTVEQAELLQGGAVLTTPSRKPHRLRESHFMQERARMEQTEGGRQIEGSRLELNADHSSEELEVWSEPSQWDLDASTLHESPQHGRELRELRGTHEVQLGASASEHDGRARDQHWSRPGGHTEEGSRHGGHREEGFTHGEPCEEGFRHGGPCEEGHDSSQSERGSPPLARPYQNESHHGSGNVLTEHLNTLAQVGDGHPLSQPRPGTPGPLLELPDRQQLYRKIFHQLDERRVDLMRLGNPQDLRVLDAEIRCLEDLLMIRTKLTALGPAEGRTDGGATRDVPSERSVDRWPSSGESLAPVDGLDLALVTDMLLLSATSPWVVFVADRVQNTICYASPSVRRLLQFTQVELIGQWVLDGVHPKDQDNFHKMLHGDSLNVLNGMTAPLSTTTPTVFFRRLRKDRSYATVQGTGRALGQRWFAWMELVLPEHNVIPAVLPATSQSHLALPAAHFTIPSSDSILPTSHPVLLPSHATINTTAPSSVPVPPTHAPPLDHIPSLAGLPSPATDPAPSPIPSRRLSPPPIYEPTAIPSIPAQFPVASAQPPMAVRAPDSDSWPDTPAKTPLHVSVHSALTPKLSRVRASLGQALAAAEADSLDATDGARGGGGGHPLPQPQRTPPQTKFAPSQLGPLAKLQTGPTQLLQSQPPLAEPQLAKAASSQQQQQPLVPGTTSSRLPLPPTSAPGAVSLAGALPITAIGPPSMSIATLSTNPPPSLGMPASVCPVSLAAAAAAQAPSSVSASAIGLLAVGVPVPTTTLPLGITAPLPAATPANSGPLPMPTAATLSPLVMSTPATLCPLPSGSPATAGALAGVTNTLTLTPPVHVVTPMTVTPSRKGDRPPTLPASTSDAILVAHARMPGGWETFPGGREILAGGWEASILEQLPPCSHGQTMLPPLLVPEGSSSGLSMGSSAPGSPYLSDVEAGGYPQCGGGGAGGSGHIRPVPPVKQPSLGASHAPMVIVQRGGAGLLQSGTASLRGSPREGPWGAPPGPDMAQEGGSGLGRRATDPGVLAKHPQKQFQQQQVQLPEVAATLQPRVATVCGSSPHPDRERAGTLRVGRVERAVWGEDDNCEAPPRQRSAGSVLSMRGTGAGFTQVPIAGTPLRVLPSSRSADNIPLWCAQASGSSDHDSLVSEAGTSSFRSPALPGQAPDFIQSSQSLSAIGLPRASLRGSGRPRKPGARRRVEDERRRGERRAEDERRMEERLQERKGGEVSALEELPATPRRRSEADVLQELGPVVPLQQGVQQDVPSEMASRVVHGPTPGFRTRGLRVLLAEDNPVSRTTGQRLLERLECEVTVSCNGREALRIMQGRASSEENPQGALPGDDDPPTPQFDLVLMDLEMPVLSGVRAVERFRQWEDEVGVPDTNRMLIFALTANTAVRDMIKCAQSRFDDFIGKPLTEKKLVQRLFNVATLPSRSGGGLRGEFGD